METFNFPYHSVETENPESGVRLKLGGSYTFTAPPSDPDQRVVTLTFPTLKFFTDPSGNLDPNIQPTLNMYSLIQFYQRHKLHKSFMYNHPVHGDMEVKFNKPLKEPSSLPGGTGAVKEFSVEFIEIL